MASRITAFVSVTLLASAPAGAYTLDQVKVESWTGTGAKASYLVVDFDATSGAAYAFGYRWDTPGTAWDMIQAIDAALATVDVDATNWGGDGPANYFIDNVTYGPDAGDVNAYWAQWEGTLTAGAVDWDLGQGVSNVTISDGLFIGLHNPWSATAAPTVPLVPEPATVALLGVALVALRRR